MRDTLAPYRPNLQLVSITRLLARGPSARGAGIAVRTPAFLVSPLLWFTQVLTTDAFLFFKVLPFRRNPSNCCIGQHHCGIVPGRPAVMTGATVGWGSPIFTTSFTPLGRTLLYLTQTWAHGYLVVAEQQ